MDFLVAFKPEQVVVIQEGIRFETSKVLVGLNSFALAADGRYQAIVHPAIMQSDSPSSIQSLKQEG
ncbi:Sporulation factor SpoIIGA [compost metagenome]